MMHEIFMLFWSIALLFLKQITYVPPIVRQLLTISICFPAEQLLATYDVRVKASGLPVMNGDR